MSTKTGVAGAAVLLVGGIAGLLWATRERLQNRLTVENRSGQAIALLRVTTGGATAVLRDVPAGAWAAGGSSHTRAEPAAGVPFRAGRLLSNVPYVADGGRRPG